ncbi:MAG: hypothetical protein ACRC13_03575 [Tannerellaceae bacterium]
MSSKVITACLYFSLRPGVEANRHCPSFAIRAPSSVPSAAYTMEPVGLLKRVRGNVKNRNMSRKANSPIVMNRAIGFLYRLETMSLIRLIRVQY